MELILATLGMAMLALVGVASVLGLTILILYELRLILRLIALLGGCAAAMTNATPPNRRSWREP